MPPQLFHGDCLEILKTLPDASVDSVVSDPPYGLEFMGASWDAPWKKDVDKANRGTQTNMVNADGKPKFATKAPAFNLGREASLGFQAWCTEWASECLRVLKPGGYLLAFGGTRTYHRMACGVEDAGFEIRDCIEWVYGSGFPRSLDVSKALDAQLRTGKSNSLALAESEKLRPVIGTARRVVSSGRRAAEGETRGGVKANMERFLNYEQADIPVTAAASPIAKTWEGWGTALKPSHEPIVVARKPFEGTVAANVLEHGTGAINLGACRVGDRWPPNLTLGHSAACSEEHCERDCPLTGIPSQEAFFPAFRYQAKAGSKDRTAGMADGLENTHPTLKPQALMEWLIRLVTAPGGHVLDPFMGSGTTGRAALALGFRFTGIEKNPEYFQIATQRVVGTATPTPQPPVDPLAFFGLEE